MSFGDKLVLWLHIGFAIFTVGPVALAISSTPRYIRRRDVQVLRYLRRITLIFTAAALLVLVFGIVLAQIDHVFSHPWLSVSLTLFVVAIALLLLIVRDQRRAIKALAAGPGPEQAVDTDSGLAAEPGPGQPDVATQAAQAAHATHVASIERGRIAALGGVVNVLWLVILALMVWRP